MVNEQRPNAVVVTRLIGYWRYDLPESGYPGIKPEQVAAYQQMRTEGLRWPDPLALVDHDWDPVERELVARHLDVGTLVNHYRGLSDCRFCRAYNGSAEMTDGTYCWPEGLSHYVRHHGVRLPKDFVEHARDEGWRVARLPVVNFDDLGQRDREWSGTNRAWSLWNASPVSEGGHTQADPAWWLAQTAAQA